VQPKDMYLIAYNSFCCAGWAVVLQTAVASLVSSDEANLADSLSNVYFANGLATMLWYSQLAALLEIVHAAVGLVRSPVVVTAMQVMSRIVALVAIAYAPKAQGMYVSLYQPKFVHLPALFDLNTSTHISIYKPQRNGAPV
jgi:hypothetical protein